MPTKRQEQITLSARNAVILSITISLVFAGVWSMQDSFLANAAKPQSNGAGKDVIANSNGFPSGKHFNLIIHGKSSYDSCGGDGGNSVFTPEYSEDYPGDQTLQLYTNKKANQFTLNVRDRCTEGFDQDPAQVQLPTKFEDGTNITDGFWVFARVHGAPDNGKFGDSNIVLTPDPKIEACNLTDEADGTESDCVDSNGNQADVIQLGFVTKDGAVYKCAEDDPNIVDCDEKLYRYDTGTSGKGAKKAKDITPLFLWSGVACEDTDGDGELTIADFDDNVMGEVGFGTIEAGEGADMDGTVITQVQIDAAEATAADTNTNMIIDTPGEFDALLQILGDDPDYDACVSETDLWVFNLFDADLVIQNQTLTNDGVKNLQIRFYPKQTTEFTPAY